MGYTTDFYGEFTITPPLNQAEVAYLRQFAETRRMERRRGPYFVQGTGIFGQGHDPDIVNFNGPDPSQPGLWCQWLPTEDGSVLCWDGGEKFYSSPHWLKYIIQTFLTGGLKDGMVKADSRLAEFTFDHVVNGTVEAQGEDPNDQWRLVVEDNVVKVARSEILYAAPEVI